MGITKKQLETIKSELASEILDLYFTLGYSVQLLEDYRSDLQIETKNITKEINKSKRKLKLLKDKMEKVEIRVPTIRKV